MHHRPHGDQACASCKHQRKKCKEDCMMAPFFPVQNNRQFRAVHKIFGVSNVAKQLKKHGSEEHRRMSADSLIWEAACWESDPIQGPLGEYQRVVDELNLCKTQYYRLVSRLPPLPLTTSQGTTNLATYNPPLPTMVPNGVLMNGWNNNNNHNRSPAAVANHNNGGGVAVMDNIINCSLLTSVTDYNEKGNSRVNHDNANVLFPYASTTNNNINGVVQDLDVQQNIASPPAPAPAPAPLPPSLAQVIQSIGDSLQDHCRDRPNGVILAPEHQRQHHAMASFNQQFFNGAGQYHPTIDANPGRNAAEILDGSMWQGNSQ